MAGLEVEGYEPVAAAISGVVVGCIDAVQPHPQADKLSVCTVHDGEQPYQVVCGAGNVRAGLKVAFARIGAQVQDDQGQLFTIKKARLRQVDSFGMLCSERELGLSDAHQGIMELPDDAPVGQSLVEYVQLKDVMIEINVTPNRADCLSVLGLAREVSVLTQASLQPPQWSPVAPTCDTAVPIRLNAGSACSCYVGRVIEQVDITAPTPIWLQERLRRSGLRSIVPVVDVTNYVMLEWGQPLHGFDLAAVHGGLTVRRAKPGESLELLDGQSLALDEGSLLIADDQGPLALAGIMGGRASGVSRRTHSIVLESAYFEPMTIAAKARAYGLHTDAAQRFERGVDPQQQVRAIERATQLLLEITGGQPGPVQVAQQAEHNAPPLEIVLHEDRIEAVLGMALSGSQIDSILTGLGLTRLKRQDQCSTWQVPSYRFDLSLEADLIEELARIYGYNQLPVVLPQARLPFQDSRAQLGKGALKQGWVNLGYQEVITYSFVSAAQQARLDPQTQSMHLLNPISDEMSVMRTSLLPGLLSTLHYNVSRQQERIRLFEMGLCFARDSQGNIEQSERLGVLLYGTRWPKNWSISDTGNVDFYDLKGDMLSALPGIEAKRWQFTAAQHPALHPAQCAQIALFDAQGALQPVGIIGALHPALAQEWALKQPCYWLQLDVAPLLDGATPRFSPLSPFPLMQRDLAMVVKESVPVQQLLDVIYAQGGDALMDVTVFDRYSGESIDPGHKSVALRLTWQHPSRTLTDNDIEQSLAQCIAQLTPLGAYLRG